MMPDDVTQPQPNIPEAFLPLVDALWDERYLMNLYNILGGVFDNACSGSPLEFYEFERIVDMVAGEAGQLSNEDYKNLLLTRLESLWPKKQPDAVAEIIKCLGNWNAELGVYVLDVASLPQNVFALFANESTGDQKIIEQCLTLARDEMDEVIAKQKLDLSLKDNKTTGRLKQIIKKFRDNLAVHWPEPIRLKPVAAPQTKVRDGQLLGFMEGFFVYDAICDLVFGRFLELDPVIGDEACEARPSFLIDIYEIILANADMDHLRLLARGYELRHSTDPDPARFWAVNQRQAESEWSQAFIDHCNGALFPEFAKLYPNAVEYLTLCKANTLASSMVADEWGMVSYDRDKGVYKGDLKANCRQRLTQCSVPFVRNMAHWVCQEGGNSLVLQQVCGVLDNANAAKLDGVSSIHTLPIYETMRTVLAYELLKGRPIVLSIYDIFVDPGTNKYSLIDVHQLAYGRDPQNIVHLIDIDSLNPLLPCASFQCYHLVNPNQPINTDDGADFFALSGDDFLNGFVNCDVRLQVLIYAAIHPVLVTGAILTGQTVPVQDYGLGAERAWQQSTVGGNGFGVNNGYSRLTVDFSLLNPVCDLAKEYENLRQVAVDRGLADKMFTTRPGNAQVCERTLESCAFTVHHVNMQSPNMIRQRDNEAIRRNAEDGPLSRYYNFDNKKSYDNEQDAHDKK